MTWSDPIVDEVRRARCVCRPFQLRSAHHLSRFEGTREAQRPQGRFLCREFHSGRAERLKKSDREPSDLARQYADKQIVPLSLDECLPANIVIDF